MTYWRTLGSAALGTSWLFTASPDIYLYAALLEATTFLMNDERVPLWSSAYENAVQRASAADDRGRWGGSVLRMRTDQPGL
jgi:hypothetical protein